MSFAPAPWRAGTSISSPSAHTLTDGTVDLVELPEWNGIHERYVARGG
jgi:hypothetical protein